MDPTEAALLRAIAALPDEDTPRLVYADYLDELGGEAKVARAEFIRLHVRAALLPHDAPERETVVRRLDELLLSWDVVWRNEMPTGFRALSGYRRGFAYRAAGKASDLGAAAGDPRLLFVECLELEADASSRQMRELVRLPLFARLTELIFRLGMLGPLGARALAEGNFRRLERLDLSRQAIGDGGLRELRESHNFPRLRFLDISGNNISAEALAQFEQSGFRARLQHLRAWGNGTPA